MSVAPRPEERETLLWKIGEASYVKDNKVFLSSPCYVCMDLKQQLDYWAEGRGLTANLGAKHIRTYYI